MNFYAGQVLSHADRYPRLPERLPTEVAVPESKGNANLSMVVRYEVSVYPPQTYPWIEELFADGIYRLPERLPIWVAVPESKGKVNRSIFERIDAPIPPQT